MATNLVSAINEMVKKVLKALVTNGCLFYFRGIIVNIIFDSEDYRTIGSIFFVESLRERKAGRQ